MSLVITFAYKCFIFFKGAFLHLEVFFSDAEVSITRFLCLFGTFKIKKKKFYAHICDYFVQLFESRYYMPCVNQHPTAPEKGCYLQ